MSILARGLRLGLGSGMTRHSLATSKVSTYMDYFSSAFSTEGTTSTPLDPDIKNRFDKLVSNNKVVVFMKGVPDEPKCGFSNAVVQIFRMHGVEQYDAHDVLKDESIRQGVKQYSNWPTVPQIYINGEFVGGCDIMIQMHQNGELIDTLGKAGIKSVLVDKEPLNK